MKAKSINTKSIESLLSNSLCPYYISIKDHTANHNKHNNYDGGMHLQAIIVSDKFIDMSLINRHRLIYEILYDHIKIDIHALSMRTMTINEYLGEK